MNTCTLHIVHFPTSLSLFLSPSLSFFCIPSEKKAGSSVRHETRRREVHECLYKTYSIYRWWCVYTVQLCCVFFLSSVASVSNVT